MSHAVLEISSSMSSEMVSYCIYAKSEGSDPTDSALLELCLHVRKAFDYHSIRLNLKSNYFKM